MLKRNVTSFFHQHRKCVLFDNIIHVILIHNENISLFQSLKNSHKYMEEIGFLQVKVIKANDLPATDLNSNVSQQSTPQCSFVAVGVISLHSTVTLCHLQRKATLCASLSSLTASCKLTRSTKLSIQSGARSSHCK